MTAVPNWVDQGYATVQNNGTALAQRTTLNCPDGSLVFTDDPVGGVTKISAPGSSALSISGTGFARVISGVLQAAASLVILTSDVTGVLPVANGGGGGAGLNGTTGQVWTSGASSPAWSTINLASSATVGSSILPVANGGTGLAAAGSSGQVLGISGGAPAWVAVPAVTSLTGDVTATGPGSSSATVVGLKGSTLPSLSAGFLQWTGSAWSFGSGSGIFSAGGDLSGSSSAQYLVGVATNAGGTVQLGDLTHALVLSQGTSLVNTTPTLTMSSSAGYSGAGVSGAGGTFTFNTGSAAVAASGTVVGSDGGALVFNFGNGAAGLGGNSPGGNAGRWAITHGTGGAGVGSGAGGASNGFQWAGGTGGAGGTTGAGGHGSDYSATTGNGGAGGATSGLPGRGGQFSWTTGTGGGSSSTAVGGGAGGSWTVTLGASAQGGATSTGTSGAGINETAGAGAPGGATSGSGGGGGSITHTTGAGGSSTSGVNGGASGGYSIIIGTPGAGGTIGVLRLDTRGGGANGTGSSIVVPSLATNGVGVMGVDNSGVLSWVSYSTVAVTSLTGDVTGTGPGATATTVVRLQGRSMLSTAPSSGQALVWGGSYWAPTSLSQDVTMTGTGAVTVVQAQNGGFVFGAPSGGTYGGASFLSGTSAVLYLGVGSSTSTPVLTSVGAGVTTTLNAGTTLQLGVAGGLYATLASISGVPTVYTAASANLAVGGTPGANTGGAVGALIVGAPNTAPSTSIASNTNSVIYADSSGNLNIYPPQVTSPVFKTTSLGVFAMNGADLVVNTTSHFSALGQGLIALAKATTNPSGNQSNGCCLYSDSSTGAFGLIVPGSGTPVLTASNTQVTITLGGVATAITGSEIQWGSNAGNIVLTGASATSPGSLSVVAPSASGSNAGGDLLLGAGASSSGTPGRVILGTNSANVLGIGGPGLGLGLWPTAVALTTGTTTLTAAQQSGPAITFGTSSLTGACTVKFASSLGSFQGVWIVDASQVTFNAHAITLEFGSTLMATTISAAAVWLIYGATQGKFYAVPLATV